MVPRELCSISFASYKEQAQNVSQAQANPAVGIDVLHHGASGTVPLRFC